MDQFEKAKKIALDIDSDLYYCPECKDYRRFSYDGAVNNNFVVCEKGHMIRKMGIKLAALDNPPISMT